MRGNKLVGNCFKPLIDTYLRVISMIWVDINKQFEDIRMKEVKAEKR